MATGNIRRRGRHRNQHDTPHCPDNDRRRAATLPDAPPLGPYLLQLAVGLHFADDLVNAGLDRAGQVLADRHSVLTFGHLDRTLDDVARRFVDPQVGRRALGDEGVRTAVITVADASDAFEGIGSATVRAGHVLPHAAVDRIRVRVKPVNIQYTCA